MSGRRSRGRRRVGNTAASHQASQSRLRVGVFDPQAVARRNERRLHCLRTQPEGPGPCRRGPDTSHRSLAMELRPLGLIPLVCRSATPTATPGRNGRYGARCDAHLRSNAEQALPTALTHAPRLPRWGARARSIPDSARWSECEVAPAACHPGSAQRYPGPIVRARRRMNGSRLSASLRPG